MRRTGGGPLSLFRRADTTELTSPKGKVEKVTGNAQIEVDTAAPKEAAVLTVVIVAGSDVRPRS